MSSRLSRYTGTRECWTSWSDSVSASRSSVSMMPSISMRGVMISCTSAEPNSTAFSNNDAPRSSSPPRRCESSCGDGITSSSSSRAEIRPGQATAASSKIKINGRRRPIRHRPWRLPAALKRRLLRGMPGEDSPPRPPRCPTAQRGCLW